MFHSEYHHLKSTEAHLEEKLPVSEVSEEIHRHLILGMAAEH